MKWCSLHQSVSHSALALLPECLLPLKQASLHTSSARPLGSSRSPTPPTPPPSCLFGPLCISTSFYLNFTSCPFSVYYFLGCGPAAPSRGSEGGTLRGVEFFLSLLAPIANRHQALWPFLHAFHPLHPSLVLLSLSEKLRFSADCFLFSLVCSHLPELE